jgi:3-oxoacid CoA-transferase subunit A
VRKLTSPEEAVARILDGHTILVGGFGLSGTPLTLVSALIDSGIAKDLTIVSNNCGYPGRGLGRLLLQDRIKKVIGSFFTPNKDVARYKSEGRLEVALLPQGTLGEAIRAGGAGIPAFYTPTAVGTQLAEGKETREFAGREYVLETALRGNVALIKAHKADENGSLVYRMAARNFNPPMATAADLVIAEVDEIVPVGALSPEEIVTPHLFVDLVVLSKSSSVS